MPRIIKSFDGFDAYLIITDKVSRFAWVFLTVGKEPPLDIVWSFLSRFGHPNGGYIQTNQGGELARSDAFRQLVADNKFKYIVKDTGLDNPKQNAGVEKYNDTLAIMVRILLYSAGLHPKYWSAALLHAVYLLNRRVHSALGRTPYEAWFKLRPNLRHLKVFGSRICSKKAGKRTSKLDKHHFNGIFIGYTATDNNIRYIDIDTGQVKRASYIIFDEAWYTASDMARPPAATYLYNLGFTQHSTPTPIPAPPPDINVDPNLSSYTSIPTPPSTTIPLSSFAIPPQIFAKHPPAAAAAKVSANTSPHTILHEFGISSKDMALIYLSPSPYSNAFEEVIERRYFGRTKHATGGMCFTNKNKCLILTDIRPSTPAAKIPRWRSQIRNAWLIKVFGQAVLTENDVTTALELFLKSNQQNCNLLFAHPEIRHGLTNDGLPQIAFDQLNHRLLLRPSDEDIRAYIPYIPPKPITGFRIFDTLDWDMDDPFDVYNCLTQVHRLTCRKLRKQDNWTAWLSSEYTQLDQYERQHMFGLPTKQASNEHTFDTVWTYNEKITDQRKKARMTCDGSPQNGKV